MGIFRKRRHTEPEPELAKLLDGYSAPRPPAPTHSTVQSVICWRCKRPNIYDARGNPPRNCLWCRAVV